MNFRSLADLVDITRRHAWELPPDIELVVGVPRSGMLPASIIALLLDRPLLDLDSFLRGDLPANGFTRDLAVKIDDIAKVRRVLIVEDSILSGKSVRDVRARLAAARPDVDATILAVIADPRAQHLVDLSFDLCRAPRIFEWNLMNSLVCGQAHFDLDGVFCRDPSEEENDDGARYRQFIATVPVRRRPGQRLRRIVTSRLETYRPETEAWLAQNGIAYERLDMMAGVTAEERRQGALHAPFKARIYAADGGARLFVESSSTQAAEIARLSGKPVLDFETMRVVGPDTVSLPYARYRAQKIIRGQKVHLGNIFRRLRNITASGR